MKTTLPNILKAPSRPEGIKENPKWLAGEGAGSWFVIIKSRNESNWEITRYSPEGNIECRGTFTSEEPFNIEEEYKITYPSHCAKVTVEQYQKKIQLISLLT